MSTNHPSIEAMEAELAGLAADDNKKIVALANKFVALKAHSAVADAARKAAYKELLEAMEADGQKVLGTDTEKLDRAVQHWIRSEFPNPDRPDRRKAAPADR